MAEENNVRQKTTRSLDKILLNIDDPKSLEEYLQRKEVENRPDSFAEYFYNLQKVRQFHDAQLQKSSDLERAYYYHIKSGRKRPGRNTILRLCLAAHLNSNETRRALEAAGLPALYARSRRDAVIQYALGKGLGVLQTNIMLRDYGEETL